MMKIFIGMLLSLAFAASAPAATAIAEGKGQFEFVDTKGRPERPIPVFTYRPAGCDAKCPIQFVLAGVDRNGSGYRDFWVDAAEKYRLVIVREDRSEYRIFGHSAGAQFVQRMAIFLPGNRASVIVAANPGSYAMPEWRKDRGADPYPYSLVASKVGEAELKRALGRKLVLMLGENDDAAASEKIDFSAETKRQGASRLERGENFFRAASAAARELGTPFAWQLVRVPNVGHSGRAMSRAAADTLYGKS